jgi:hypothetical protein
MYLKKHASEELGPGRLLWHYTDFAGLNGIVNGTMWASNLRFLNDTQEFRYAVEIAMKVLSEELRNDGDHFKSMLASLRTLFHFRKKRTTWPSGADTAPMVARPLRWGLTQKHWKRKLPMRISACIECYTRMMRLQGV